MLNQMIDGKMYLGEQPEFYPKKATVKKIANVPLVYPILQRVLLQVFSSVPSFPTRRTASAADCNKETAGGREQHTKLVKSDSHTF